MMCYDQNRSIFDHVVIYEDLLDHPQEETVNMFEKLNIPTKHLPNVLTAFVKDSQGRFFGYTDGTKPDVFTSHQWHEVASLFKQFELPMSHSMTMNEFRDFVHEIETY